MKSIDVKFFKGTVPKEITEDDLVATQEKRSEIFNVLVPALPVIPTIMQFNLLLKKEDLGDKALEMDGYVAEVILEALSHSIDKMGPGAHRNMHVLEYKDPATGETVTNTYTIIVEIE
jgi:hypothetical protein